MKLDGKAMGTAIALGLVFGVAIHSFALGIGIGALIGVALAIRR